jgi:hypothetical protein
VLPGAAADPLQPGRLAGRPPSARPLGELDQGLMKAGEELPTSENAQPTLKNPDALQWLPIFFLHRATMLSLAFRLRGLLCCLGKL